MNTTVRIQSSRVSPGVVGRSRGQARAAFTLIEVILAIVISLGMLVVVLFFYQQTANFRAQLVEETERLTAVRLINHAFLDGAIYLHSAIDGHKLENLAFCDRVSYCVVADREVDPAEVSTTYSSAIVFGRAVRLEDREERRKGLMALLEKYCPNHMDAGLRELENDFEHTTVLRVDIHRITGKARRKDG